MSEKPTNRNSSKSYVESTTAMADVAAAGPNAGRAAVVGMFDGVHRGHRFLLDSLKAEAAKRRLAPAVFTFPGHPLEIVNPAIAPKLLSEPEEKFTLLSDAGIAPDDINFLVFDSKLRALTATEFLKMLREKYNVRFLLRGFNNSFGSERILTADDYRRIAADNGIELREATDFNLKDGEHQVAVSSSLIRRALLEGDIRLANAMLGHPYELSGEVVSGKQIGRTIGFPTANIRPGNQAKLTPGNGVYICRAIIGEKAYRAMVNIGKRPTIDSDNSALTIEAYLLDFSGDIYNQQLRLQFFEILRHEKRFSSPEELARQLTTDRIATENFTFADF